MDVMRSHGQMFTLPIIQGLNFTGNGVTNVKIFLWVVSSSLYDIYEGSAPGYFMLDSPTKITEVIINFESEMTNVSIDIYGCFASMYLFHCC